MKLDPLQGKQLNWLYLLSVLTKQQSCCGRRGRDWQFLGALLFAINLSTNAMLPNKLRRWAFEREWNRAWNLIFANTHCLDATFPSRKL